MTNAPKPNPAEPPAGTERPVLLILYADGEIVVPRATTYGDLLTPMDIITQEAAKLRSSLLRIPLRQPEPPA